MLAVLVRAVHSDPADARPTIEAKRESSSAAASTPALMQQRPAMWRAAGVKATATNDDSDESPSSAPSLADDHAPPATRGNTTHLEFGGTQLRAQAEAVRPLVDKCIDEAKAKGPLPSGTAVLTYIVAKHGDKFEVEDTGFDEDKTTLEHGELLDCLHHTALGMHFEGLPREASGLVVTRRVTLDFGKLGEYKHVGFSYLR